MNVTLAETIVNQLSLAQNSSFEDCIWSSFKEGVILKKANSPPRITARRGGGVTKKMVRSLVIDAAGEVFLVPSIGTPPRPSESGCCAIFS